MFVIHNTEIDLQEKSAQVRVKYPNGSKKVQETSLEMVTVYTIFKINFSKLTSKRNCCHAKISHH